MEINEDQSNEHKQRLFIQSLQGSQLSSLFLLAETQRQEEDWEEFIMRKRGRLQMCPEWRLLAWAHSRWANWKWGSARYLLVRGT